MTNQVLTPADLEMIEMPKLDEAINWLVGLVNRQLAAGSRSLMAGNELTVMFRYGDFVHHYHYIGYWRDHCGDIADIFRAQDWDVTEYPSYTPTYSSSEAQPYLGFRAVLE